MRDLHVRPCQPFAVEEQEWLDGVAALERLDVTVLADERFGVATIGSDDSPVRLLTDQIARICAARGGLSWVLPGIVSPDLDGIQRYVQIRTKAIAAFGRPSG